MRRTSTPAITAQMYRHFAVWTVVLTGLVAFFANGEKQDAVAAETQASQPHPQASKPAATTPDPPVEDGGGSWGSDNTADWAGQTGSELPSSLEDPVRRRTRDDADLRDRVDGDQGDADGQAPASAPGPSADQLAAAMAASRMRSGARGID